MTPYYEHAGITIYHGDCLDLLPLAADLCVTDPPYNLGIQYGTGTNDERVDYASWCRQWFDKIHPEVDSCAISTGVANVAMWCQIKEPDWIIAWHKPAAMGRCMFGFNNWEPVLFYGKPKRNRGTDVVQAGILPDAALRGHPCPKPELWAIGLISLLSDYGDTVIDPFIGTGTVLVAAKRLNRQAIGIEIEERYCEIAAKRLSQEVLPLEMIV